MNQWCFVLAFALSSVFTPVQASDNEPPRAEDYFEEYPHLNISQAQLDGAFNEALLMPFEVDESLPVDTLFPHESRTLINQSSPSAQHIIKGLANVIAVVGDDDLSHAFIQTHRAFLEATSADIFVVSVNSEASLNQLIGDSPLKFHLVNGDALHETFGITQYPIILKGETP